MSYLSTVTSLGLAKIALAISNSEPLNIATMKIGDGNGNPTTPTAADTDLVRVVYTGTPNRVDVDPLDESRIICELIVPVGSGGYTVREVGIYDDDGDLIAISQFPEAYKPNEAEGAVSDLAIRMYMVVSNNAAITLSIDGSVTVATRDWVQDQLALLIPGGTTDQILKKVSNADGDYVWANPDDVNITVATIQEEQTLAAAQTIVTLATVTTDGLAVYVEGVRLHPSDWTATDEVTVTLSEAYAAGSKILLVRNDPAGNAEYLNKGLNLSDVQNKEEARGNLELLTNGPYLAALLIELNKLMYPVGEMWTTRRVGNPSALLGFGTWEPYAAGRVLVGYDGADTSFNELDKTGGAKTHALSIAEMPSHRHTLPEGKDNGITDGIYTDSSPNPSNTSTTEIQTSAVGGGNAHNNLQPYITVFMWKRTA